MEKSEKWFAITRWCAEDVIAAAKEQGVTLTPEQAERWLEKNEGWFHDMLTEYGNEVLASASKESYEDVADDGFTDEVGGYHEGGCGTDPDGDFCGECSNSSCASCGMWARKKKEVSEK